MKTIKKVLRIFSLALVIAALLCAAAFVFLRSQFLPVQKSAPDGSSGETIRFEVPYGTSLYAVSEALAEEGIIKNARLFYYAARYPKVLRVLFPSEPAVRSFTLRSGVYLLSGRLSSVEIIQMFAEGETEYIKVSVPEGLTISKIAAVMESAQICPKEDFIAACRNPEVFSGYPLRELFDEGKIRTCEGFLFPDTYYLNFGMSAESVVRIMVDNFFRKTAQVQNLGGKSADELFETVTLASIVEREYRVDDEAPLIASVFKNRLADNIGLYSCATIEYIITEIQGKPHPDVILISDTQINSPYNTYKWAGLPPGPISNPGLIALDAATNTPGTNYYFFQVINPAEGRHVFTSTFEEHKINRVYTKKAAGN